MIRGNVARIQGDESAMALFEESLSLLRELGDTWSIAVQLGDFGNLVRERGDHERATTLFNQCLAMRQGWGDRVGVARSLMDLGRVAYEQGHHERASQLYCQSLRLYREVAHRWGPVACLEGLAALAVATGQPKRCARLFGAADRLREEITAPLSPAERAAYERDIGRARAQTDEDTITAAWAEGRAMTLEQAVAYALEEQPSA
jgi:hypothetical protein